MHKWVAGAVGVLLLVYFVTADRAVRHGPGVIAPNAPVQKKIDSGAPFKFGDEYTLTPVADFEVEARVLSRQRYRYGRESDLAPVDLALGWGPMSDEKILDEIRISQSGRFYYWRVRRFPIPRKDIVGHSTNMHLIPSSREVDRLIKNVRTGQIVRFRGKLVNIFAQDGWRWRTSLSRTDSGDGACELVWVESFEIK